VVDVFRIKFGHPVANFAVARLFLGGFLKSPLAFLVE